MTVAALVALVLSAPQTDDVPRRLPSNTEDRIDKAVEKAFNAAEQPPRPRPKIAFEPAPNPLPHLRWDQDVLCADLSPSPQVPSGQYHVQCDAEHTCLAAPSHVIGPDGVETDQELTRGLVCQLTPTDWAGKAAAGYKFIPAIAEVQPGWIRDERGRSMQYNFDLHRRAYLGIAYAPMVGNTTDFARIRGDVGLNIEVPSDDGHWLYRWTVMESEFTGAFGNSPSSIDMTGLRLDWSTGKNAPLLFITTFFGEPRRHDFNLDWGAWFETMHWELIARNGQRASFLTLGAGNVGFDLWHSKDMVSFLRVRGGPAAELDTKTGVVSLKPEVAVEGDWTLDADGFHHFKASAETETVMTGGSFDPSNNPTRLRLRAGYEVIVLAINDQPLSLVADLKSTYRNDLVALAPLSGSNPWVLDVGAEVGLRFSFWAPARRNVPLERGH